MADMIGFLDQCITQTGTDRAWHHKDKQVELNGLDNGMFAEVIKMNYPVYCLPLARADTGHVIKG